MSGLLDLAGEAGPAPVEPAIHLCSKVGLEMLDQVRARELGLYFDAAERGRIANSYKTWRGISLGAQASAIVFDTGRTQNAIECMRVLLLHPDKFDNIRRKVVKGDLSNVSIIFDAPEFQQAVRVYAEKGAPTYPFAVQIKTLAAAYNMARRKALGEGKSQHEADEAAEAARAQSEADLVASAPTSTLRYGANHRPS